MRTLIIDNGKHFLKYNKTIFTLPDALNLSLISPDEFNKLNQYLKRAKHERHAEVYLDALLRPGTASDVKEQKTQSEFSPGLIKMSEKDLYSEFPITTGPEALHIIKAWDEGFEYIRSLIYNTYTRYRFDQRNLGLSWEDAEKRQEDLHRETDVLMEKIEQALEKPNTLQLNKLLKAIYLLEKKIYFYTCEFERDLPTLYQAHQIIQDQCRFLKQYIAFQRRKSAATSPCFYDKSDKTSLIAETAAVGPCSKAVALDLCFQAEAHNPWSQAETKEKKEQIERFAFKLFKDGVSNGHTDAATNTATSEATEIFRASLLATAPPQSDSNTKPAGSPLRNGSKKG